MPTQGAKLSEAEVRNLISKYNQYKSDFNQVVTELKSKMYDLTSSWKGQASDTFRTRTEELFKNMLSVQESVDGSINKLNEAVRDYSALEEENVSSIGKLAEGESDYKKNAVKVT